MIRKLICLLRGHHKWVFAYNYGIPLNCTWSYDEIKARKEKGEVFEVHKCRTCGMYDHDSDGLSPERGN